MSTSNCNHIAHEFEELAHAHYHSERYVYNTYTHSTLFHSVPYLQQS